MSKALNHIDALSCDDYEPKFRRRVTEGTEVT